MKSLFLMAVVAGLVLVNTGAAADITIPVTIRDFTPATNPDFQRPGSFETGIVQSTLGADNKPVYAGDDDGTGSTTGPASFNQWYNDVYGVNDSIIYNLPLVDVGGGIYTYSSGAFFPIDGQLFGDYAYGHNYHFTLEMHSTFTYQTDQEFSFSGDDDLWVFIDKELAIDLGGIHGELSRSVDLDTLGLTPGETYAFDLFFAERHTTGSNFRIETSIVFDSPAQPAAVPVPGALLLGLTGTGLVGLLRRRSR